jgi:hypothetical protein
MRTAFRRIVFGFILAITIAAPVACGQKDAQPRLAEGSNPSLHEKAPPLPAEANQLARR